MKKQLRDYQQTAFNEIMAHCFDCWKNGKVEHIVLEGSVGFGKTLLIAALAKFINDKIAHKGGTVLCLADQGELVEQNAEEAWGFGLKNSVFAASLNSKSTAYPTIYGMRQTLVNALGKPPFDTMRPAILIIDECHKWDFEREGSQAYEVYQHFAANNPNLLVVGVTGTPYRGVEPIYGEGRFFARKTETSFGTDYLQNENWLIREHYGFHTKNEAIDFSSLDMRDNNETGGNYSEDEIDKLYQGEAEKTFTICREIVHNTYAPEELGVLIFCGSKFHTTQVKYGLEMAGVKPDEIAIVTDNTSDNERMKARKKAQTGEVKYFVNVGVASTGWNVPRWKHIVYMRPIGSLVFFKQSIGRVLRPYLSKDAAIEFNSAETTSLEVRESILLASEKPEAFVHDYAGVYERLAPYLDDDMEVQKAARKRAKDEDETVPCPRCNFENSPFAQRCANVIDGQRCTHFYSFVLCRNKDCKDEDGEHTKNSPMAHSCRICGDVIKDPNAALLNKAYDDSEYRAVAKMEIELAKNQKGLTVKYHLVEPDESLGLPQVYYHLDQSNWARGAWYNGFLKTHCNKAWRSRFHMMSAPNIVKQKAVFDTPTHITVRKNDKGKFIIAKARFRSGREAETQTA